MWVTESLARLMLYLSNPDNLPGLFDYLRGLIDYLRGLIDWWIGFVLMYAASGVLLTGIYLWLFDFLGLSDWERAKKPGREKRGLKLHPIEILLYVALLPLMVLGGVLLNIYVYQPALNP